MKKFLKLTTVVVSMVMALAFVSCANGNENGKLNLVGTYSVSKIEELWKNSEDKSALTMTMPTSTSFRQHSILKTIDGETTDEIDVTVTKTSDGYKFKWEKYIVDGVAQNDEAKAEMETLFDDDTWNEITAMFTVTITTTAEGTWSNNLSPASSGTYTVDEANSKVTLTTLIDGGEILSEPETMEATYSNNGKKLFVVDEYSEEECSAKSTITLIRK
ncbi:MAG: hypothetical protein MR958_06815 [Spirochaetia bacterium]|nr:hypothetical protein [Spirochaetia bacterium]